MKKKLAGGLLVLPFLVILNSCNKKEQKALTPLQELGKGVYVSNCIACHNPDPRLQGSVGPDIAFSSLELIKARVTNANYPAGYKPKRSSQIMPAFPQLEKDVVALHAYLNSFTK